MLATAALYNHDPARPEQPSMIEPQYRTNPTSRANEER